MDILSSNPQFQIAQLNAASAATQQATDAANNKGRTEKEARAVAETFEAVFLSQMLNTMFETVPENEMFGGGQGEEMFRGMQVEQFGKEIAKSGGIGIADHVFREIMRQQEVGVE